MCPPSYHHDNFVATHARGHIMYIYMIYMMYMVFTTERFLEVLTESWSERDLNP